MSISDTGFFFEKMVRKIPSATGSSESRQVAFFVFSFLLMDVWVRWEDECVCGHESFSRIPSLHLHMTTLNTQFQENGAKDVIC